ncbi:MAG: hypothetical protein AAF363_18325 [Bacteroidota bacterium]
MRHSIFIRVLISFIMLNISCRQSGESGLSSCKNLPNIEFKDQKIGTDVDKTFKLLTELAAAAESDVLLSKAIDAEADINVKSEFAKKLKQNISASQNVNDDFWEQNITLTQLLCFTESQSKRQDLSPEERTHFTQLLTKILSDRNEYLNQRSIKKKSR